MSDEPAEKGPVEESAAASAGEGSTGAGQPDATRPDQPQGGDHPNADASAGASDAAASEASESQQAQELEEKQGEPQGEQLHGCPVVDSLGATVVHADRDRYLPLMQGLKEDGFDLPVGVLGVDYLTHPGRQLPDGIAPGRFEVVVELVSVADNRRLRVRCQVPADDAAVPTLFDLWPGVEAHEREVYDMYGIRFDGHPDPTRILMPEDWEGHPLRKDYATGHVAVQFKEAPGAG